MNVLSIKSRILNFRLTEDEYQSLQKASQDNGARSVSDYARSVLLSPLAADEPRSLTDELLHRLNELETRVSALMETTQAVQPGDPAAE
jgi:hypothetical protein